MEASLLGFGCPAKDGVLLCSGLPILLNIGQRYGMHLNPGQKAGNYWRVLVKFFFTPNIKIISTKFVEKINASVAPQIARYIGN
jgi:hypothetical protein